MSRPAVTVLVTPVDDPRALDRCLAALRPTVRPGDRVEVVVDGRLPEITTALVAELHADVLVTPHWLDRLVAALDDPAATAAGPRSNLAPPGQHVAEVAYGRGRHTSLRDFARLWSAQHQGVARRATRPLSSSCRVRRQPAAPGDELVVDGVFVHHDAAPGCPDLTVPSTPAGRPLLTAALIVKDEEDVLPDCLAALSATCDEIVVYDTGSTDRTRQIAAEHGAIVVEGYWDDDFGAARNRGLAHCTGRWVLWVDADEVLRGDAVALRTSLAADPREGLLVPIRNLGDRGAGSDVQHVALRLFRRQVAVLVGRLHEQVVHERLGRSLTGDRTELVSLDHSGYRAARLEKKDKARRNLAIAQLAGSTSPTADDDPMVAINLARSVGLSGDSEQALELFERVWPRDFYAAAKRQLATEAMTLALGRGDLALALLWVDRLAEAGELEHPLAVARAVVLQRRGEHAAALALVESLPERYPNADGMVTQGLSVAGLHASLLEGAGRHVEAAELLLTALRADFMDVPLSALVRVVRQAGRSLTDVVHAVPPRLRVQVAAQSSGLEPADADDLLESMWQLSPGTELLVVAVGLAPRLAVPRALEWSIRLRERGLDDRCPLIALAGTATRTARDRVVAAACALEHLDDPRAMALLETALAQVSDAQAPEVLAELAVIAPRLAAAIEPTAELSPAG